MQPYDVVVWPVGSFGDMDLAVLLGGEDGNWRIRSRVYGQGDWFETTTAKCWTPNASRQNEPHWQSTVAEAERLKAAPASSPE